MNLETIMKVSLESELLTEIIDSSKEENQQLISLLTDRRDHINEKYDIANMKVSNERSLFGKLTDKLSNIMVSISDTTGTSLKELDIELEKLSNLKDDKKQKELSEPVKKSIVNMLSGLAVAAKVDKLDDSGLVELGRKLQSFTLVDLNSQIEQYMNGNKNNLSGLNKEFNGLEHLYDTPEKYFKNAKWYNLRGSKINNFKTRSKRGLFKRFVGMKDSPVITQQVIAIVNDKITFLFITAKGDSVSASIITETLSDKYKEGLIKGLDLAFSKTSLISFCRTVAKYATSTKFNKSYLSKLTDNVDKLDLKEDGSQENLDRKIFSSKILPTYSKAYLINRKMIPLNASMVNKLARLHLGIYKAKDLTIKVESDQILTIPTSVELEDEDEDEIEYNRESDEFNSNMYDIVSSLNEMNVPISNTFETLYS